VIRDHVHHLHHVIDEQPISIRLAITVVAALSLPLLGTGVKTLGGALDLGQFVLPLLVLAHVPVVIALIAVWSVGCDVCRSEGSA